MKHGREPEGMLAAAAKLVRVARPTKCTTGTRASESLTIGGPSRVPAPGDTPSRRKIFVCRPKAAGEERACAEDRLPRWRERAYRRPLAHDAEIARADGLLRRPDAAKAASKPGLQIGAGAMLADPNFLFRIERDPPTRRPGNRIRSPKRSGTGLAALVLPVEQHPRR